MRVLLVEFLPHVLGSGGSEEEKCKYYCFFFVLFLDSLSASISPTMYNLGTFESRVNRNILERAQSYRLFRCLACISCNCER